MTDWQAFVATHIAHSSLQSRIRHADDGKYLLDGKRLTARELCEMPLPPDLEALRMRIETYHVTLIKYRLQAAGNRAPALN